MHPSPLPGPGSTAAASADQQPNQSADWAYQALTVAAMILLLGSLLLFW